MRNHILVFVFAIIIGLCGCAETLNAAGQTSNEISLALMTQYGEISPFGTSWTVRVSADDRTLHISRHYSFGTTITSWETWRAKKGWFVFVENDERVWAYDGDDLYLLVALGTKGTASYYICKFPCRVPDAVLTRISPAARRAIKDHS